MLNASERVKQRLFRAAAAMDGARVDETAVRNTQDVDILLRRSDLEAARGAMEAAGFVHRHSAGMEVFLDGPAAKARDAVHLIFANEKVRPHEPAANPDVSESEAADQFRVLSLEPLVKIKLTAFRDKDKVHIRDLMDVGLVDETWLTRLPAELATRLKLLLDTPGG
jgi:hypothetical protein